MEEDLAGASRSIQSVNGPDTEASYDHDTADDDNLILGSPAASDEKSSETRAVMEIENVPEPRSEVGALVTCWAIFKSLGPIGILFAPKVFKNGGYVFTPVALIGSLFATLFCAKLLLDVHDRLGGCSFTEMAFRAYGKRGKVLIEVLIAFSCFGFGTTFVYFIASQIGGALGVVTCMTSNFARCQSGFELSMSDWILICSLICVPIVLVRNIQVFSFWQRGGDIILIVTMIVIFIYAEASLEMHGARFGRIKPLAYLWTEVIGFSAYMFGGISAILPIKEVSSCKDNFYSLVCITVCFTVFLYVFVGEFILIAWGSSENFFHPLITATLPPKESVTYTIKILLSLQLYLQYPLAIFPTNSIVESWLFASWP